MADVYIDSVINNCNTIFDQQVAAAKQKFKAAIDSLVQKCISDINKIPNSSNDKPISDAIFTFENSITPLYDTFRADFQTATTNWTNNMNAGLKTVTAFDVTRYVCYAWLNNNCIDWHPEPGLDQNFTTKLNNSSSHIAEVSQGLSGEMSQYVSDDRDKYNDASKIKWRLLIDDAVSHISGIVIPDWQPPAINPNSLPDSTEYHLFADTVSSAFDQGVTDFNSRFTMLYDEEYYKSATSTISSILSKLVPIATKFNTWMISSCIAYYHNKFDPLLDMIDSGQCRSQYENLLSSTLSNIKSYIDQHPLEGNVNNSYRQSQLNSLTTHVRQLVTDSMVYLQSAPCLKDVTDLLNIFYTDLDNLLPKFDTHGLNLNEQISEMYSDIQSSATSINLAISNLESDVNFKLSQFNQNTSDLLNQTQFSIPLISQVRTVLPPGGFKPGARNSVYVTYKNISNKVWWGYFEIKLIDQYGNVLIPPPTTTMYDIQPGESRTIELDFFLPTSVVSSQITGMSVFVGSSDGDCLTVSDANMFHLCRFKASDSGSVDTINFQTNAPGNSMFAIYSDDFGQPGSLLSKSASVPVATGVNNITIPPVSIVSGSYYWLAFNSDAKCICNGKYTGTKFSRSADFNMFDFPPSVGIGFVQATTNVALIAGVSLNPSAITDVSRKFGTISKYNIIVNTNLELSK